MEKSSHTGFIYCDKRKFQVTCCESEKKIFYFSCSIYVYYSGYLSIISERIKRGECFCRKLVGERNFRSGNLKNTFENYKQLNKVFYDTNKESF